MNNLHATEDYLSLERHGYWCDSDEWDTRGKVFRFSMSALEEMLMTGEGTTLEYKETTGGVEPVLEPGGHFRTMHGRVTAPSC